MCDWIRIQHCCWPLAPHKQAANHDVLWDGSANNCQPLREAGAQSHLEWIGVVANLEGCATAIQEHLQGVSHQADHLGRDLTYSDHFPWF